MLQKILHKPFFIKLFNWEYWPFNIVYAPVYLYWMWLALRSRSFFFFSTANPTIKNAGFLLESKKEIYDLIRQQYHPVTLFFEQGEKIRNVIRKLKSSRMAFPFGC